MRQGGVNATGNLKGGSEAKFVEELQAIRENLEAASASEFLAALARGLTPGNTSFEKLG